VLGAFAVALVWTGVVLSFSRAGLAVAIAGTVVLLSLLSQRRRLAALVALLVLLPTVGLLWKEVRAPGERFVTTSDDLSSLGQRLPVWQATLTAMPDYWLLGSGLGTYGSVFLFYRHPETKKRWDHAHNDWIESTLEGGILTTACLIWILFSVVRALYRSTVESGSKASLAAASIAAILAIAIHSCVDFSLRIPAVALTAAFVIGASHSITPRRIDGHPPNNLSIVEHS